MEAQLVEKLAARRAHVVVVGLGYVGLPLAVEVAQAGFRVTGFDVDAGRVAALTAGRSYIPDVPGESVARLAREGRLGATADEAVLAAADAVIVCVPTPLRKTKDPDISYVVAVSDALEKHVHAGMLVVVESTTYPGFTREIVLPRLQSGGAGLKVGESFFLAFSPERIDPGNQSFGVRNTPKVVGGTTEACRRVAGTLYRQFVDQVVEVSSTDSAEMVKLLENTFRAVNIGLVNEVCIMCNKLGIDTWEVIDAAATKPFGFTPFYPGPGLGGHCIPVDPHYLSWKLKTLEYDARFIEVASQVNSAMPQVVVQRVADALNDTRKSVNGSRVLVLGVAYKRNIDDVRESPALDIVRLLQGRRAVVSYHDPHVPALRPAGDGAEMRSVALTPEIVRAQDCVVVVTDHRDVDYAMVAHEASLIVDTRNAYKGHRGVTGGERHVAARIVRL
jgi:UDP-N-acetyl-D-glucosamine dehydrogenase